MGALYLGFKKYEQPKTVISAMVTLLSKEQEMVIFMLLAKSMENPLSFW